MGSFHLKPPFIVFIVSTLLLSYNFCHADRNVERGWTCSEPDNSTVGNSFQTKLNNILYSLASIVSHNSGFYKATAGKDFNEIYGLIQCRGDISAQDCTNCTGESIKVALHRCPESESVVVWFTWCFLRYSDETFFGVSEQYGLGTFDTNGSWAHLHLRLQISL
ncbi:cysteine-rich repeat secretory protein 38-like [Cornus florida]|uniref:cysteine-rich repeat secretory protein 38-like n=1 Tax=Cornus florida TaxID=4283 RepID=UPI002898812D|nr:cysteine-rich repeat secretory protein 38-like [Cornus florida]